MNDLRFKIKDLRFAACLLLIAYCFIFSPKAFAQTNDSGLIPRQNLSVSPIISDLKIVPGHPNSFNLKIKNLSSEPLGIHAEVSNLLEPDSEEIEEISSPLVKWTKITPTDFILEAKGEKAIKVTLKPPEDIAEGGFYGVIYLTPFVAGQNQEAKPVVLSRIGALVFATSGEINYKDLKEKVEVSRFEPSNFFLNKPEYSLELDVDNRYFTHFSAKPAVTIAKIFGGSEKQEIEEKHILPGRKRSWNIAGKVNSWGVYKADLRLSVGNGETITKNAIFVYLPIKDILLSILIVFVIFIIIIRRKRLKKALKILTSGK